MDRAALLSLYDEELRHKAPYFDDAVRLDRDASVVRLIGATADARNNGVLFSALDEAGAAAAVDRQIAFFTALGRGFEWKWHEHDPPASLPRLLKERGFAPDEPEQVLTLELGRSPAASALPAGFSIRRILPGESLEPVFRVQREVWKGETLTWLEESLERERRNRPDDILFHVVERGGEPVTMGWTRVHGRFASLYGGSTLAAYRGRGLYRALLEARLTAAQGRGAELASVDAGAMSAPILRRMGFERLTGTTPYLRAL